MGNKRSTKEICEADVSTVVRAIQMDLGAVDITFHISPTPHYPFKCSATAWWGEGPERRLYASHEFYTTQRYPSTVFVMWKAAESLYSAIDRSRQGLPPYI